MGRGGRRIRGRRVHRRGHVARERAHVLLLLHHHRHDRAHRHVLRAVPDANLGDVPILLRFELHGGFVRLDLRDGVPGADLVALLNLPPRDVTLGHRRGQRRHRELLSFLLKFGSVVR